MFKFKKSLILTFMFLFIQIFNFTNAYDKFAKIVFIGNLGSGKTTLFNLLTNSRNEDHTSQIKSKRLEYDVSIPVWESNHGIKSLFKSRKLVNKYKSVCAYFFDCSGEPFHQQLMQEFCKNADIVFITIDAFDLFETKLYCGNYEKRLDSLENLVSNLKFYTPDCSLILVFTKKGNINKQYSCGIRNYNFALNEIDHYGNYFRSKFPVYETYYYTSGNADGSSRNNLENTIKNILKYRFDHLRSTPDGFRADIVEKEVIDQEYRPSSGCDNGQRKITHKEYKLNWH